jgi:UDPglucose 6-dehydrogenase
LAAHLQPGVRWRDDAYEATTGADVLVFITEWNDFRAPRLDRLATIMNRPSIADLRNVYNPEDAAKAGFASALIGRAMSSKGLIDTGAGA